MPANDWISRWLRPLAELLTLSAGSTRRISWVSFTTENDGRPQGPSTLQLFTSAITQRPYDAAKPTAAAPDDRPLFTRRDLPVDLPTLIQHWSELQASDNPFPELFRLVSTQDLPLRARYLYLVQALEALHSAENVAVDEDRQARHTARRDEFLANIEAAIDRSLTAREKDLIPKKPIDNLERRINGLLEVTPTPVVETLAVDPSDAVVTRYSDENAPATFVGVVRQLRNDLSHGTYTPSDSELERWVAHLDRLARAQMLRLLGFGEDTIGNRLGRTTTRG